MLSLHEHVTRTNEDFQLHQFPSRVQLLLDFEKMFTRVSRKGIRSILSQRFPHLLNLYDLNSGHATRSSYFRTPDGLWQFIEQEEGLVQGCPLSTPISSLVLARIVAIIQEELDVRADERKRTGDFGDGGSGSRSQRPTWMIPTLAYRMSLWHSSFNVSRNLVHPMVLCSACPRTSL